MVGQCRVQIEVFLFWHADDRVVLRQERIELTIFGAEEPPKIIKAQRVRPAVKGAGWSLLIVRCEMPLAEGSGSVAVPLQDLRDRGRALRPVRVIAGPTAFQFRDRAEPDRMMIAPREQCGACRRTQRCNVESVVAQALGGHLVERRRGHRPAERRWIAEPGVVNQHQENVRCVLGCLHGLLKGWNRTVQRRLGDALERLGGTRQHTPVPRCIRTRC